MKLVVSVDEVLAAFLGQELVDLARVDSATKRLPPPPATPRFTLETLRRPCKVLS